MKTIKQLKKEAGKEKVHELNYYLAGQLKQSEDILKLIDKEKEIFSVRQWDKKMESLKE